MTIKCDNCNGSIEGSTKDPTTPIFVRKIPDTNKKYCFYCAREKKITNSYEEFRNFKNAADNG